MKKLITKARGSGAYYDDNSFEFSPQSKGEPVYEHSYKVGEAQIGLTKGEKNQHYVVKLKCGIDEADPRETLHEQLDRLTAKVCFCHWQRKKTLRLRCI